MSQAHKGRCEVPSPARVEAEFPFTSCHSYPNILPSRVKERLKRLLTPSVPASQSFLAYARDLWIPASPAVTGCRYGQFINCEQLSPGEWT